MIPLPASRTTIGEHRTSMTRQVHATEGLFRCHIKLEACQTDRMLFELCESEGCMALRQGNRAFAPPRYQQPISNLCFQQMAVSAKAVLHALKCREVRTDLLMTLSRRECKLELVPEDCLLPVRGCATYSSSLLPVTTQTATDCCAY